jgi:hypothetical protein
MVIYTCNPSTQEAEAREFQIQGQPQLHRFHLKKQKQKKKKPPLSVPQGIGSSWFQDP